MSKHSHGFRPNRGCHSALREIQANWTGSRWFIEGDIAKYFDTINHDVLLEILGEKLHDNRFLRLIGRLLQLTHAEKNAQQTLHTNGSQIRSLTGNERDNRRSTKNCASSYNGFLLTTQLTTQLILIDLRLRYVRYADDTLLGEAAPRQEAEEIKLELSEDKTLITQASRQPARFLGYELVNQQNDSLARTETAQRQRQNWITSPGRCGGKEKRSVCATGKTHPSR